MSDELGFDFEEFLERELQDEDFRAEYERLAPAFEVANLRMERGLTQKQLAELVGTRQSSISRLESGSRDPSLSFLRRIAQALDARVEVRLVKMVGAQATETAEESGQTVERGLIKSASLQIAESPTKYTTPTTHES